MVIQEKKNNTVQINNNGYIGEKKNSTIQIENLGEKKNQYYAD